MDFKSSTPKSSWAAAQSRRSRAADDTHQEGHAPPLQMYLLPPTGHLSLEQFDQLAVERLQLLRIVEKANQVSKVKYSTEWTGMLFADLKQQKLTTYLNMLTGREDTSVTSEEAEYRDLVSHFILRLAYCRTDELKSWFIQHELDLFRLRFQKVMAVQMSSQQRGERVLATGVDNFLADNGIHLDVVSEEERRQRHTALLEGTHRLSATQLEHTSWYRVPFTEVLDLVRNRRCYLEAGRAYVPDRDLGSIVGAVFKSHLQHALAMARRLIPVAEEDSRLKGLLADFDKRYTGRDYSAGRDASAVTPDMLNELSSLSFPPCMREQHERLRANHRLLHGGRLQYGLFLRAIGVSLEDAVQFWRDEYTHIMDAEQFRKRYVYNIRHMYGQEGRRSAYGAQPCSKILAGGAANGSGCPFRHYDRDAVAKMLTGYGVDKDGRADILEAVAAAQPQLACHRYWERVHAPASFEGVLQHPNQWYDESRRSRAGPRAKTDRGVDKSRITRATLPARRSPSQSTPADDSCQWDDDDFDLPDGDAAQVALPSADAAAPAGGPAEAAAA